jgi:tetratricopeptide (TPR) repeat protein
MFADYSNNDIAVINTASGAPEDRPNIMTGTLDFKIDMRFFNGRGGGAITVTIDGLAASELRRRIDDRYYLTLNVLNRNNSKVDGSLSASGTEVAAFIELVEDRLELNDITNQYDFINRASRTYDGIFAGADISRKGGAEGVDITGETGLSGSAITSQQPITLEINFGASLAENVGNPDLSNGEILFYGLFGYEPRTWAAINETNPEISCKETVESIIMGLGNYNDANKEDGDFSKFRMLAGEIVTYTQTYDLGSASDAGYINYEPFNFVQSSLILAIYGLIVSIIMLSLPRTYFKKSGREKKIQWIHIMAIAFFALIIVLYLFGINGLIIIIGAPLFAAVTGIIAAKKYASKGELSNRPPGGNDLNSQWHKKGLEAYQQGDMDGALDNFERALEQNMQDEIIWNDKGHVLRKVGRYDDALKCFNLALKINPNFENARRNKQLTFEDMKKSR